MKERTTERRTAAGRQGSALIVALWTIVLLSMLVMSFAWDANLEGRIGVYIRQRRRVDCMTQSGLAIAEMLLLEYQNVSTSSSDDDDDDRWREPKLRLKRGQTAVVAERIGEEETAGTVRVEIIPEPSRWNINKLVGTQYDELWEQIFTMSGIPQDYFSSLIDCWNDWVDADSIPLRDGAEDDYYKSLTPPYKARNKEIDTVDELRLVKGFVPAILDGGVLNPEEKNEDLQIRVRGIKDLFTTYGDGKINVNAAPMEVLMTIPGIDEIIAGAIVEEREGRVEGGAASLGSHSATRRTNGSSDDEEDYSFKSDGDFISRIPGLDSSISQYVSVQSGTFRLVIEGESAGITHRVEAIAEVEGSQVRYLRWREDR